MTQCRDIDIQNFPLDLLQPEHLIRHSTKPYPRTEQEVDRITPYKGMAKLSKHRYRSFRRSVGRQ